MRKADILFYISLGITPIGITLRINDYIIGNALFGYGLLGIIIYFTASIIRSIKKKNFNKADLFIKSLIIIVAPIILSKYLYYGFGDYLGIIIIPIFVITTLINFISKLKRNIKITLTSIVFCILIVPLFDIDFKNDPRNFIPLNWYHIHNTNRLHPIDLFYRFNSQEAKSLADKALKARNKKEYYHSIYLLKQAKSIDTDNPTLYFGLSEIYVFINELELAKNELDTAINLDDKNPIFYNNRGILYNRLSENGNAVIDFRKAIEIDSTQYFYYCNLASVFIETMEYDEACKLIDKAVALGANLDEYESLKRLREKYK